MFAAPETDHALILREGISQVPAGGFLFLLPDPAGAVSYEKAQSSDVAARFAPAAAENPNFGFTNHPYWGRLSIQNHSQRSEWILLFEYPRTDRIDVFFESAGRRTEFHTGDHFPFSRRPLPHTGFAMPIRIAPGQSGMVHFRLQTQGTLQMPIRIVHPLHFAELEAREIGFLCLIYGIMLAMFGYNLFLFFSIGDRSYLYYVLYIGSSILLQMAFNGMADRYLWGEFVWWADRSFVFLTAANVVLAVIFSRRFLRLASSWPLGNRVALICISFGCVAIATFVWLPLSAATRIGAAFVFVGVGWILVAAVYLNLRGYQPARFFLVAWATFLVGALVYGLQKAGLLPRAFVTEYMYQIGTAAEVVLLSLALGDRINHLQKQVLEEQASAVAEQIRISRSLERFVPKQIFELLGRKHITEVQLGDAAARTMTVLFADIRRFTSLSEGMTPVENFRFLNSYLKRVGPIIRRHGGFIDKYIGDAVMSLFPERPEQALLAAIEMQEAVRLYNHHRLRQAYDPIRVGIGIHTGSVIIGTIGEEERLEGTVISDAVNLAARIEDLTKVYEASILISQDTLVQLADPGAYRFRVVDQVRVRGKREPVTVVEVFDGQSDYLLELFEATRSDFDKGVNAFLVEDFERAAVLFAAVLARNPNDRAAQIYLERSREFTARPAGSSP